MGLRTTANTKIWRRQLKAVEKTSSCQLKLLSTGARGSPKGLVIWMLLCSVTVSVTITINLKHPSESAVSEAPTVLSIIDPFLDDTITSVSIGLGVRVFNIFGQRLSII